MNDPRRKREEKVARRYGGRARPASGAIWGLKGDVRKAGVYLLEHKETSKSSYRFSIRDFMYLQKNCTDPLAVFCVQFPDAVLFLVPTAKKGKEISTTTTALRPDSTGVLTFTRYNKSIEILREEEFLTLLEIL